MQSDNYHFVTNWRLHGTIEQIAAILRDPADLPRWWPSVYVEVSKTKDGAASGVGAEYDLMTKAWLPYTLRWHMKLTETREPHGFTLETKGDLVGVGVWTLVQHGDNVEAAFDWEVVARKPIMRLMSAVTRPLISANHRWAMSRGQMSLERELALRAAETDRDREALPPPPGPMPAAGAWATFVLVMLSIVLPGSVLMRLLKRRADRAE